MSVIQLTKRKDVHATIAINAATTKTSLTLQLILLLPPQLLWY